VAPRRPDHVGFGSAAAIDQISADAARSRGAGYLRIARAGDFAKWMLEDPRIKFSISKRGSQPGVDHLGLQVEDDSELRDMRTRLFDCIPVFGEDTQLPLAASACCIPVAHD
jgi:hypothetical protein